MTTELKPSGIALSPDGKYAYIVHWGSKTLQIVNTSTRQTVDTILIESWGDGWHDLAVSPDGRYAYLVARYYSDAVAIVDLEAREIVGSIYSGSHPSDIVLSPDGTLAYVTNENNNSISVLDLKQKQKLAEISVGAAPLGIALSASGSSAYVTNSGNGTVSVVDLDSRSVTGTISVGSTPQGIVVTEDGALAYVANRSSNTISVLDLGTSTQLGTIATDSQPTNVSLTVSADPGLYSMTGSDDSILEYDGSAYSRTYPNGSRVSFNADGTHDRTVDRLGNTTAYSYNPDGSTATMDITPAGSSEPQWTWSFAYAGGRLDSITDPAGRVTSFSIDGNNHLKSATGPGGTRFFAYDSRGLMTQESDEAGTMTTHEYDDYGRVTKVRKAPRPVTDSTSGSSESGEETISFTTVDTGYPLLNEIAFSDPDNPAATPLASEALIARVQYERGRTEGTMDRWGRWKTKTDAEGHSTSFERDSAGNLLERHYDDGSCQVFQYDLSGNMLANAKMESAQCALDPADRDMAQMQITAYSYEERFNKVKTVTDPEGNRRTYLYDYEEDPNENGTGNLIRIDYPQVEDENGDPVTPSVSYTYNAAGQVTTMTDEAGTITRYVYTSGSADEAFGGATPLFNDGVRPVPGLLTQRIEDDGGVNQTTNYRAFNALGKPGTVTRPGNQVSYYTYDALGRVTAKTNAQGIVTTFAYDAAGNVEQSIVDYTADGTTGHNIVTEYTYDADNHLLRARSTADGLLRETSYAYDENGKLASVTNPNGNTTTYSYTDGNRLASVTDAMDRSTRYTYTAKGQVETITLPNGTVMKYVYNGLGQKIQRIEDDGGLNLSTRYSYYANGTLETVTDPENVLTRYTYDALKRRKSMLQDEGGLNLSTSYRYSDDGNTVSITNPRNVVTVVQRDALDRLSSRRNDADGENLSSSYSYHASGKLETLSDPRGTVTRYEYDDYNRLEALHEDANGLDLVTGYAYDRLNKLSTITDPKGIVEFTEYSAFGDPLYTVEDLNGLAARTEFTHDAIGNLRSVTDDNRNTTHYEYNAGNQLARIRYADRSTVTQSYTPLGAVDLRTDQAGRTIDNDYDDLGRLSGRTLPGGRRPSPTMLTTA